LNIAGVFIVTGVIKFAKSRAGCRYRLYRIAEENHAKTRLGVSEDGILYQGVSSHLQFQVVFKDENQAEDFETAVKKIPLEYRKRKRTDEECYDIVVPDIEVEVEPIQRLVWTQRLIRIEEGDYQKNTEDENPSPDYNLSYTHTSVVTINNEVRLRLLEREDSIMLFRQKTEKCHIIRRADNKSIEKNPNNIVFMSRYLHHHFDAIDSTEGIPTFYFLYAGHNRSPTQGLVNNWPTAVYETVIHVVFKDEEAKNTLTPFFKNPTALNETTIEITAFFPDPEQFKLFAESNAELTMAKWRSYDGALDS